jgi:hypothetical protein
MNKKLKTGLIVLGSVTAVVVTSLLIAKAVKNRKIRKQLEEEEKEKSEQLQIIQANLGTSQPTSDSYNPSSAKVIPIRNFNKEIINPLNEILGVAVRPAQKSSDPEKGHVIAINKTNVRTSPETNNAGTHWSGLDSGNLAGTIEGDKPFGVIVGEAFDNMSPKMRWFEVCLIDGLRDCSGYGIFGSQCTTIGRGWVRADTVTFKSFDRPSIDMRAKNRANCTLNKKDIVGFDGRHDFEQKSVVKYSNNLLGADVFPHSNWMLPTKQRNIAGTALEFDDILDL